MKSRELLPPSLAALVLIGAHVLPSPRNGNLANIPSICPLKNLVGLPCPGCGMTRSLVLCAHGDWSGAAAFHPLGPVFYLTLWVALISGVVLRRKPIVFSNRQLIIGGSTFAASLLIVWVVRLAGIVPFPAHF